MPGFDPNQPRDEEGKWTEAGNAARRAAGLLGERDIPDKGMNESGLSKDKLQGVEKVRIRKESGGGSGYIYEYSPSGLFVGVYQKPEGKGEFLGYYHLSDLK